MRPDGRSAHAQPSFLEEDSNGWLVTFSDLVLQLFAFVLVAAVLGTGSIGREPAPAGVPSASQPVAPASRVERSAPAPERLARPVADALTLARFDVPAPKPGPIAVSAVAPSVPVAAPVAAPVEPATTRDATARAPAVPEPPTSPSELPPSLASELESFIAEAGLDEAVQVSVSGGGVTLSISDTIGFASGSAELLPDAAPVLAEVRQLVAARPDLVVEVSGHTDDRPLHTGAFRSNLDLSLARAARVAHQLADGDDDLTERIFATGYGAARPVAENDDAEGRARNRRVELRLVQGHDRAPAIAMARMR